MKYIRRAKNTPNAKRFPADFITEVVDASKYNKHHEALGGWEKVTQGECKKLCDANEGLLRDFFDERSVRNHEIRAAKVEQQKLEDAEINAEFEAFKAWKATQK